MTTLVQVTVRPDVESRAYRWLLLECGQWKNDIKSRVVAYRVLLINNTCTVLVEMKASICFMKSCYCMNTHRNSFVPRSIQSSVISKCERTMT